MKRKETDYKGLDTFDVFFEDTSEQSDQVFAITEFPSRLTAGKNLIKLKGHPTNLRVGSYLNIEVLDFNGDPIYSEVVSYLDVDKSRVIAIYVYEETPPGTATITLLGELQSLNGAPVPEEWQGRSNVRWSKQISVNPSIANNTEIIFETTPSASITEQIGPQLDRIYPNNQQFPEYTTGTVRYFLQNGQPAIELTNGTFQKEMEGGTITVTSPQNPRPTPTYTPVSTTYSSKIAKVLSDTLLLLETDFSVISNQSIFPHTYSEFDASSYSLSYEATPQYVATQNSESYAHIDIYGLEPATGDVDRIKVFLNGAGTIGTWEQINDIELDEIELFIDENNVFPDFAIGQFSSQSIIDTYWASKRYNGLTELSAPTVTQITGSVANGAYIETPIGADLTSKTSVITFETLPEYAATFVSQSSYKITIDALGTRIGADNPTLSLYLSGSAFPYDSTDRLNQELPRKLGRKIGEISITGASQRFDDELFEFEALETGTASLIFVVESGEWTLSDIRTTTDNDTGYSPAYTRIRTVVPTKHKLKNQYRFRIEYYNTDGVKSRQVTETGNLDWSGGNRYIDGDYSMMTGSLYVANTLESGIGITGNTNTGFIRSLGYSGFEFGAPGFMIWSGSALPGFNTAKGGVAYSDVGIEMYANDDNFFRYSTTAGGELDIRTQEFFVGNSNTFLSASNGNLQISSSGLNILNGVISASAVNISSQIQTGVSTFEAYTVLDTSQRIIDATNIGKIIYQEATGPSFTLTNTGFQNIATYEAPVFVGEEQLAFEFQVNQGVETGILVPYLEITGSYISGSYTVEDSGNRIVIAQPSLNNWVSALSSSKNGVFTDASGAYRITQFYTIPSDLQGHYCEFEINMRGDGTGGSSRSYTFTDLVSWTTRRSNAFSIQAVAEDVQEIPAGPGA